ncbi:hypothetical protein GCM10025868_24040 [Angustibacter aerolatus]|uniref:Uncharacterized protein n=1 Tax=Angustibacter aerolatus TaxID=1162965 RepID=A0ABQ6JJ64_9ACTN|nr:hypothetical protein GCM10025868_24040 [Angustibacter aerolatus]
MKVVVWVMKPGPIAEVAMRNMAPSRVDRVLAFILPDAVSSSATSGSGGVLDIDQPLRRGRCGAAVPAGRRGPAGPAGLRDQALGADHVHGCCAWRTMASRHASNVASLTW